MSPVEHDTTQRVGGISPGIDSDTFGQDFGLQGNRMPMHDNYAEGSLMPQKVLADPHKVMRILLLQRNLRPDAGMDEKIVPASEAQLEIL